MKLRALPGPVWTHSRDPTDPGHTIGVSVGKFESRGWLRHLHALVGGLASSYCELDDCSLRSPPDKKLETITRCQCVASIPANSSSNMLIHAILSSHLPR
jgi:hypothetical protein